MSSAGSAACNLCRAGSFADAASQECLPCPKGQYSPTDGATSCSQLPSGFYAAADGTLASCAAGQFLDSADLACKRCRSGSFSAASGAIECAEVPAGAPPAPSPSHFLPCAFFTRAQLQLPKLCSHRCHCEGLLSPSLHPLLLPLACADSSGSYSSEDGTAALPCPPASVSAPASGSIESCLCPAGSFPLFSSSRPWAQNASSACGPCPAGGSCDPLVGGGQPRGLEGFWRASPSSLRFYSCRAGLCLAEQDAAAPVNGSWEGRASRCRPGHTGVLCGSCDAGLAYQGEFCVPCSPDKDIRRWSEGRRGIAVAGLGALLLAAAAVFLLSPLTLPALRRLAQRLRGCLPTAPRKGPTQATSAPQPESKEGNGQQQHEQGAAGSLLRLKVTAAVERGQQLWPFVSYAKVPLRLMVGAHGNRGALHAFRSLIRRAGSGFQSPRVSSSAGSD